MRTCGLSASSSVGFRGIVAQNIGDCMGEIEALTVGAVAQRLNLRRALQALVE